MKFLLTLAFTLPTLLLSMHVSHSAQVDLEEVFTPNFDLQVQPSIRPSTLVDS